MTSVPPSIDAPTKTCTQCCVDRPISRFPHSKFTADGRTDRCLDCIKETARRDRQLRAARLAAHGHFHIRKPRTHHKIGNQAFRAGWRRSDHHLDFEKVTGKSKNATRR